MTVMPKSLSRREFLYRVAAVGGTGLLLTTLNAWGGEMQSSASAPPRLIGNGRGRTVIILGAGLAGMSAAYELGNLGYDCRLVEARSFAGGRCQTARRGMTIKEYGGETQTCDFDRGYISTTAPGAFHTIINRSCITPACFKCRLKSWSTITILPMSIGKATIRCAIGAYDKSRSRPTCADTSPNCSPRR